MPDKSARRIDRGSAYIWSIIISQGVWGSSPVTLEWDLISLLGGAKSNLGYAGSEMFVSDDPAGTIGNFESASVTVWVSGVLDRSCRRSSKYGAWRYARGMHVVARGCARCFIGSL